MTDGPIIDAAEITRDILAACATWQTWTGAADAEEARESTYLAGFGPETLPDDGADQASDTARDAVGVDELESKRPFAVVIPGESGTLRFSRNGSNGAFQFGGSVSLYIEADAPEGDETEPDYAVAVAEFLENLGKVVSEMCAASEANGMLLQSGDVAGWGRITEDGVPGQRALFTAHIMLNWGLDT